MSDVIGLLITSGILVGYAGIGALVGGWLFAEIKMRGWTDDDAHGAAAVAAALWPIYVTVFFILGPPAIKIWRAGVFIHAQFRREPIPKAKVIR